MMENKRLYIMVLVLFFMSACSKTTITTYEDYLSWLDNDDNGLVMKKKANGITVKVKYMPSNYLAYQDLYKEKKIKKEVVDSIVKIYDKSITILMTIGVDGELKKGDVMYQNVKDYEEYKKRLYALNFDIEQFTSLKIGDKTYHPVLSSLENVYGLTDSRNITLVFVPETEKEESFYLAEEIKFSYDDELFDTGINHFTFNRENINNTPTFIFWN